VGRKKQKSTPQDEGGVTAMLRRLGEEQIREAASGAVQAEQIVRTTLGDEAGSLLKALPPQDRATAAYELFQRIEDDPKNFDVSVWLSMRVRRTRHHLEQAANAAAGIKAERSRGGKAGSAAQRARWQPWRDALCKYAKVSHPGNAPEHVKKRWVESVMYRSGAKIPKPQLYEDVPPHLPTIRGRSGKPPKEDTIRLNLFGSRSR
jgi:hypothetical protein